MVERGVLVLVLLAGAGLAADINVLWINDNKNTVAKSAINAAFEYLNNEPSVKVVSKEMIDANDTNVQIALEKVCGKLETMIDSGSSPDLVLDSTRLGVLSEVIKSLSRTMGMPTVSMSYGGKGDLREWQGLTPDQEKYMIQIRPPGDILPESIRQIIRLRNITNAAILYDESFAMKHKLKNLLQNLPVRHMMVKLKPKAKDLNQQLRKLDDVNMNNFFMFGSRESITKILNTINEMKMYGTKYKWFAFTKDAANSFDCDCSDLEAVYLHPTNSRKMAALEEEFEFLGPEVDAGFYFDVAVKAMMAVSNMKASGSWPTDMKYTKCSDFKDLGDAVSRSDLDLMAALKAVQKPETFGPLMIDRNGMSHMTFDVDISKLKYKKGSLIKTDDIGMWAAGLPGNLVYKPGMSLARMSEQSVYKIVTIVQPPFVVKYTENGKTMYKGYCIDLLNEIRDRLNFDYEIYTVPDGKFGTQNEDGEWNGVIKELVDKNADIGLGSLSIMAERETVVDFTIPIYDMVGITIMMLMPKTETSLFKFLSVLEDSVWGCILAAYIVTSFLMWVFDRYSPYSYQNNMEKYADDDERRYFDLKECLWFCMTSLTPQGGGEAPKNLSGRLVAATWWLFGFIIIASYTANLAAFLTVSRLETPVESLEDLSKQYKILYSPLNGSATMTYFERMAYVEERFYEIWKDMSLNDSLSNLERSKLAVWDYPVSDKYTKMWQSMKEAGLPQTFDEAIEWVRRSPSSSEGFAFLGDATDIRYQVLTNCDLQEVGEEFSRKPYGIALQKGSPLKEQFDDVILQLLNLRKLESLKEKWWNDNPERVTCPVDEEAAGGISIYNIGGVFIVIFVGIGLAFVALVWEYYWYKFGKPVSRVGSVDTKSKQFQVKQATTIKTDFSAEYSNTASNIAPTRENQW